MGCKMEACAECTKQCVLIHGKKKNSSLVVNSFFKVMIGDGFSKVLFLPPKFAATVSSLVNQKTFLEDSSGQQWRITISNLDGSLAFEQGWSSFVEDHGLKVGDFLVFNYILESGFVVKIFNATGCEKLDFSENTNACRRTRFNGNSTGRHHQCCKTDEGSMNKQSSSTSIVSASDAEIGQSQSELKNVEETVKVPENIFKNENSSGMTTHVSKPEYMEEPYFLINRDLGDKQGDDRSPLFDLFSLEMANNSSGANVANKAFIKDAKFFHTVKSQTETCLVVKDPVAKVVTTLARNEENVSYMPNGGITKCLVPEGLESVSQKIQGAVSPEERTLLIDDCPSAKQKSKATPEFWDVPTAGEMPDCQCGLVKEEPVKMTPDLCSHQKITGEKMTGEIIGLVKEEPVKMTPDLCSRKKMTQEIWDEIKGEHGQNSGTTVRAKDNVLRVVKSEPVDSVGISSPIKTRLSCLVTTENQSYLELPRCLPSSCRGLSRIGRKVVFLQDPAMRLWPVLYHETSGFKILSSGWEAFSKANNVQPGDECVFLLVSEPESLYGVRIARRKR
ncbi:hypothetical protein CJ030_MR4G021025 [Morella rubra]|uniref:TF-B3 domain-containing protein n=1 Tax=Morella rubra TaxID=262757 RepID=A0A6A1VZ16_9ROSI|nr:hypothetical protein CJ030_MR4G021025 [Morella rubra]